MEVKRESRNSFANKDSWKYMSDHISPSDHTISGRMNNDIQNGAGSAIISNSETNNQNTTIPRNNADHRSLDTECDKFTLMGYERQAGSITTPQKNQRKDESKPLNNFEAGQNCRNDLKNVSKNDKNNQLRMDNNNINTPHNTNIVNNVNNIDNNNDIDDNGINDPGLQLDIDIDDESNSDELTSEVRNNGHHHNANNGNNNQDPNNYIVSNSPPIDDVGLAVNIGNLDISEALNYGNENNIHNNNHNNHNNINNQTILTNGNSNNDNTLDDDEESQTPAELVEANQQRFAHAQAQAQAQIQEENENGINEDNKQNYLQNNDNINTNGQYGGQHQMNGTGNNNNNNRRRIVIMGASKTPHDPAGDKGSQTMEKWLKQENLIVHPVWIGNLPRHTTVADLREFVEKIIGRVLVSIHISVKQTTSANGQTGERTYAFLNLPTAEKQLLAVTLLDQHTFHGEKLIVRPKKPSKFPQSFFGSSPISEHFKHFRDSVVPSIMINPQINLNVQSVRKILEQHGINLDHLPNRVWCVQCTLAPNCHRTYCSFYHSHQEKELGRIISILAAQSCGEATFVDENGNLVLSNGSGASGDSTVRSRHTLLVQGLPKTTTQAKVRELFEVFGPIDNILVNPNHTCYVRMKRAQDARKIVHLLKYNNAGISIDFAPYSASSAVTSNGSQSTQLGNHASQQLPLTNSASVKQPEKKHLKPLLTKANSTTTNINTNTNIIDRNQFSMSPNMKQRQQRIQNFQTFPAPLNAQQMQNSSSSSSSSVPASPSRFTRSMSDMNPNNIDNNSNTLLTTTSQPSQQYNGNQLQYNNNNNNINISNRHPQKQYKNLSLNPHSQSMNIRNLQDRKRGSNQLHTHLETYNTTNNNNQQNRSQNINVNNGNNTLVSPGFGQVNQNSRYHRVHNRKNNNTNNNTNNNNNFVNNNRFNNQNGNYVHNNSNSVTYNRPSLKNVQSLPLPPGHSSVPIPRIVQTDMTSEQLMQQQQQRQQIQSISNNQMQSLTSQDQQYFSPNQTQSQSQSQSQTSNYDMFSPQQQPRTHTQSGEEVQYSNYGQYIQSRTGTSLPYRSRRTKPNLNLINSQSYQPNQSPDPSFYQFDGRSNNQRQSQQNNQNQQYTPQQIQQYYQQQHHQQQQQPQQQYTQQQLLNQYQLNNNNFGRDELHLHAAHSHPVAMGMNQYTQHQQRLTTRQQQPFVNNMYSNNNNNLSARERLQLNQQSQSYYQVNNHSNNHYQPSHRSQQLPFQKANSMNGISAATGIDNDNWGLIEDMKSIPTNDRDPSQSQNYVTTPSYYVNNINTDIISQNQGQNLDDAYPEGPVPTTPDLDVDNEIDDILNQTLKG